MVSGLVYCESTALMVQQRELPGSHACSSTRADAVLSYETLATCSGCCLHSAACDGCPEGSYLPALSRDPRGGATRSVQVAGMSLPTRNAGAGVQRALLRPLEWAAPLNVLNLPPPRALRCGSPGSYMAFLISAMHIVVRRLCCTPACWQPRQRRIEQGLCVICLPGSCS
jgi:hypothetical protein